MSKVIFTADIHFGVAGRLADIVFACRVMREYAQKAGIDTVVVLGDLFHDRQSLGIDVLNAACKFFEETKEEYGQQWIVFPGNHDLFLKHSWQINSLMPMRQHLTVIEDVKVLTLDTQRFIVLPFITYEKSYMKVLKRIASRCQPGDKLLTHIGVCGATLNTCFLLKDWSIINFDDMPFDRVYTGHFHSRQCVGNVHYPGSPIPFKFDEGDVPHGFYVYDTVEDDHKFINIWKAAAKLIPDEIPPPQFCTVLDEQLDQLEESDINNNMVRIALQREYTDNEKREIKDRLHEMGARRVRWWNMNTTAEETKNKQQIVNAATKDLFRAWILNDEKGIKDLDIGLLNKLHDEISQEGDEIYVLEEIGSL